MRIVAVNWSGTRILLVPGIGTRIFGPTIPTAASPALPSRLARVMSRPTNVSSDRNNTEAHERSPEPQFRLTPAQEDAHWVCGLLGRYTNLTPKRTPPTCCSDAHVHHYGAQAGTASGLLQGLGTLHEFLGRDVLLVRSNPPPVADRILYARVAVPIKLVCWLHEC